MRNITLAGTITDAFDVWDPQLNDDGFGVGGFQTFTKSGSDYVVSPGGGSYGANLSVSNFIESGMAFYIKGSTSGNATVTEGCKTTGSSVVNRPANPAAAGARLLYSLQANTATNTSLLDGGFIDFDDNNSNAVDFTDVRKNMNFTINFGIATANTYDLIVERRAMPVITDTLFFSMKGLSARAYQLGFKPESLDNTVLFAYLEDTYLATSTSLSLLTNNTYNFEVTNVAASAAAKRFMIVFKTQAPLPVTFTQVRGYQQANKIAVEWKVSNQLNLSQYQVEKSVNGRTFVTAGTVAAINVNSSAAYNWLDVNPVQGANYYRIKSVDLNGRFQYSQIVTVILGNTASSITVAPNPIEGNVMNVQFVNKPQGRYSVRLVNQLGQVIVTQVAEIAAGSQIQNIPLPSQTSKGVYQLEIIAPDKSKTTQKIIIQ